MKVRASRPHRNPNGNWCHCPFGDPEKEPYASKTDWEAFGSVTAMWREAAKIDWLRDREDMQDTDSQQYLNNLQTRFPEHDSLYPWLVREWKKDRVRPYTFHPSGGAQYQDPYPFTHINHEGQNEGLDTHDLRTIQDWMKYKKQAKQGVDIMKHEIGPALHLARQNDLGGEIVHDFDAEDHRDKLDPPYHHDEDYRPNGFKMVRLRDKRDLRREGARCNHCIGSNGQGYDNKLANGDGLYYSLRDSKNQPHATLELNKVAESYMKCPNCGQFGTEVFDPQTGGEKCRHCGFLTSPPERPNPAFDEDRYFQTIHDDVASRKRMQESARADGIPVTDTDFESPEYVKKYLDDPVNTAAWKTPDETKDKLLQRWKNGEARPAVLPPLRLPPENVPEVQRFPVDLKKVGNKPNAMVAQPTQLFGNNDNKLEDWQEHLVNEFLAKHGHAYYESDGEPEEEEEEYEPWWASSYNVPGASGEQEWIDHTNGDFHDYAPDEYHLAVSDADEHGFEPPELDNEEAPDVDSVFEDMANNHLRNGVKPQRIAEMFKTMQDQGYGGEFRENAKNWLDDEYHPYLDPYGQHNGPGFDVSRNNHTVPFGQGPAPELPGSHYPDSHPSEKYFALNLQHHLDEYDRSHDLDRNRYPDEMGSGLRPQIPDIIHPQPEQPWGTHGRSPWSGPEQGTWPSPTAHPDETTFSPYRPNIPREIGEPPTPGLMPDAPLSSPNVQHDYFPETTPDIRHQRPIPGFEQAYGIRPFDPFNKEYYPAGHAQGQLMPPAWYVDYEKRHAAPTTLPEHLFPPDKFGYHVDPNQQTMWDNERAPLGEGFARVHTIPMRERSVALEAGQPDPVMQQWQASIQSGVWTDAEEERAQPLADSQTQIIKHTPRILEIKPKTPYLFADMNWRRPVVYDRNEDHMYVGQSAMEHNDMMRQIGKENPWTTQRDAAHWAAPGYIDTEGVLGGGLNFFNDERPPQDEHFHNWVRSALGVDRPQSNPYTEQDWVSKTAFSGSPGQLDPGYIGWNEATDPDWKEDGSRPQRQLFQPRPPDPDDLLKAKYHAEKNPFMWQGPGTEGKAFMDTNGVVHTWDNDLNSKHWMHSNQAKMRGVQLDYNSHIYMNSDGSVRDAYDVAAYNPEKAKEMYHQLQEQHPGTTWAALDGLQLAPQSEHSSEFAHENWD